MKCRIPGGNGQSMNSMLKQAQKMQEDMAALQQDLETREYTASSGGGVVTVTIDGSYKIRSLKIKPEAVDPDDSEMLEDLVTVAVNEAIENAKRTSDNEMSAITSGLNIPGLM